jgi:DNA-binding CsgD family transcriptional regulator
MSIPNGNQNNAEINLAKRFPSLTPQEIRISTLLHKGKRTDEIANLLSISSQTVQTHIKHIKTKIAVPKKYASLRTYLMSLPRGIS